MNEASKKAHWSDVAVEAVTRAARKAGIALEGITIRYATIDRTWGDKDGLVVIGGAEETRARVAAFLIKWLSKNLPTLLPRSYACQTGVAAEAKACGWLWQESLGLSGSDGVFPLAPPSYKTEEEKAAYRARVRPALAIPCVYYPCGG